MSTGKSKRVIQGLETRQRIFEAALDLFSKRGYEVSVEDICLAVGVTRGAFYNHFESKEHIIIEYYMELIDKQYKELGPELVELEDPLVLLKEFTRYAAEVTMQLGPELMGVVYSYQLSPERKTLPIIYLKERSLYATVEKMVQRASDKGVLKTDMDTKSICNLLIRSQRGTIMEWCVTRGGIDLMAQMLEFCDVITSGLIKD